MYKTVAAFSNHSFFSIKAFDKLFYKCIKMSKNSLTKYYQDNKTIKKAPQRYQSLSKEEKNLDNVVKDDEKNLSQDENNCLSI